MAVALKKVRDKYEGLLKLDRDINLLTKDYLIRDIDSCIYDWKHLPWLKELSREDFYEYYLPYKCVEGQPLDDWRQIADLSDKGDMPILNNSDNNFITARAGYKAIHEYLQSVNLMNGPEPPLRYFTLRPDAMSHAHGTNCFGRSYAEMMFFRANRVPVATEFTPCWMIHGEQHSWVSLIGGVSSDQQMEPWTINYDPGYFKDNSFRPSRVYRMGWSARKILIDAKRHGVKIPSKLNHPFVKDVTDLYNKTCDIRLRCTSLTGYVFLSVFDGMDWTAVDIAESCLGFVSFKKVTKAATYCIISQEGEQLSRPFFLNPQGHIEFYEKGKATGIVKISRKFPQGQPTFKIRDRIAGGDIYGSIDGLNYKKIGRIDPHVLVAQKCNISYHEKWKYLKIIPDGNSELDIADIYVYDTEKKHIELSLHSRAFDGDPLTYETVTSREGLTIPLDEEVNLDHISIVKRGDGNDIIPGHVYELLFNDGSHWISSEFKTAEDIEISFENIPQNALMWIRDLDGGTENAIFTYKSGCVEWK